MAQKKSPKESYVEMREMVMPHQANPHTTIFGGVVMSWIDMAAAMVAQRHSKKHVVTVHVDQLSFKAPIKIGDHVLIQANVNYVGKTSMEVGVKVTSENPISGETHHTTTAYLTFVALDSNNKPTSIPELDIQSPDEKRRFKEALERVEIRKKLRK